MWETQLGENVHNLESLDLLKSFAEKAGKQLHLAPSHRFLRRQPVSTGVTSASTATTFKLKTSFTANRDHHPWAWGLPGQQRGHALALVGRSHDRNSQKISPSWGLSGIHSRKLELHLSLRLSKYLGHPSCLTACFSWTYATLITLADLCLFVRLDWNRLTGSEVIGVAQIFIHMVWWETWMSSSLIL